MEQSIVKIGHGISENPQIATAFCLLWTIFKSCFFSKCYFSQSRSQLKKDRRSRERSSGRWRERSDDLRSLATTTIRDRRFFSLRSWSLMGLNDPWSLKITICGNDLLFTIVIDDHDQRSTICEKDGFYGLRAWGRSSDPGSKSEKTLQCTVSYQLYYLWSTFEVVSNDFDEIFMKFKNLYKAKKVC